VGKKLFIALMLVVGALVLAMGIRDANWITGLLGALLILNGVARASGKANC